jgi:hypothetical protein
VRRDADTPRKMLDDPVIRAKARVALQRGTLPARLPDRTWGGYGVGVKCAICELPVTKQEVEFEIEYGEGHHPGIDTFHVQCSVFRGVGVRADAWGRVNFGARRSKPLKEGGSSPLCLQWAS